MLRRAVHGCGLDNDSRMGRNILWSSGEGKCYIIDFERAVFGPASQMPALWEDFESWTFGC